MGSRRSLVARFGPMLLFLIAATVLGFAFHVAAVFGTIPLPTVAIFGAGVVAGWQVTRRQILKARALAASGEVESPQGRRRRDWAMGGIGCGALLVGLGQPWRGLMFTLLTGFLWGFFSAMVSLARTSNQRPAS
jgi:hypothetical protein